MSAVRPHSPDEAERLAEHRQADRAYAGRIETKLASMATSLADVRRHAETEPAFYRAYYGLAEVVPDVRVVAIAEAEAELEVLSREREGAELRLQMLRGEWSRGDVDADRGDPHGGDRPIGDNPVHDSRHPGMIEVVNGRSSGRGRGVLTPMWGYAKPEPQGWVIRGLVPAEYATILAADGGVGKSFLALLLATCVALGVPFLGLPVERRRVLFVDYELDERVARRRHYAILSGMGLTPAAADLEGWFYHYRPGAYLPGGAHEVADLVHRYGVGLTILDSLTVASQGDAMAQKDVTAVMNALRSCGTVFALDHVSAAGARGGAAQARPFGSVFKRNLARSSFTLAKAEGGGLILRPDKSNFGPGHDLLCYQVTYRNDASGDLQAVTFKRVLASSDPMAGLLSHLSSPEITGYAVEALYHERPNAYAAVGVSAEEVAEWREAQGYPLAVGTVRNHLTALKNQRKIRSHEASGFLPALSQGDPV